MFCCKSIIPSTNAEGQMSWSLFRTSVDEVEKPTSYDLLSEVPQSVQQVMEVQVDAITL